MLKKLMVALIFAITVTEASAETCNLTALPSSIPEGGTATLFLESTTPIIIQGIGTVMGYTLVSPKETTTYTGTVQGGTETCSTTVTVVVIPPNLKNLIGTWEMTFLNGSTTFSGDIVQVPPMILPMDINEIQKNGNDGIIFHGTFPSVANSFVSIWINTQNPKDVFMTLYIPISVEVTSEQELRTREYFGSFNMVIIPENSEKIAVGIMTGVQWLYEYKSYGFAGETELLFHSNVYMKTSPDGIGDKRK